MKTQPICTVHSDNRIISSFTVLTVSPQGLTESAGISLTTSPTPELSTHTDRTTFIATNAPNTTNVTITADEHITSFTNSTHISVTASPTTHSHTQDLFNMTVQRTTESGYPSTMLTSTQESASDEMRNETEVHTEQPEGISSATPEEYSTTGNIFKSPERPSSGDKYGENENKGKVLKPQYFTLFTSKHVSVRCENFFIHCQSASSSLVMLLDHLVHFLWGLPTK